MKNTVFSEGLHIRYKNYVGHVKFVCEDYITLCIHTNPNPLKDVCILIYPNQWCNVELLSGNRGGDK